MGMNGAPCCRAGGSAIGLSATDARRFLIFFSAGDEQNYFLSHKGTSQFALCGAHHEAPMPLSTGTHIGLSEWKLPNTAALLFMRVFFVDDEALIVLLATSWLEDLGCEVPRSMLPKRSPNSGVIPVSRCYLLM